MTNPVDSEIQLMDLDALSIKRERSLFGPFLAYRDELLDSLQGRSNNCLHIEYSENSGLRHSFALRGKASLMEKILVMDNCSVHRNACRYDANFFSNPSVSLSIVAAIDKLHPCHCDSSS